jgi:predicted RNase H-like nuclease
MWVAGVDGCPAGWLAVFRSLAGEAPSACIFESLKQVLSAPEQPTIVAVDVPIGLPKVSQKGGRAADIECRKILGARRSSVFPPPSRAVLAASSYLEACEIELSNSMPAKKINRETFNILHKIREADAVVASFKGRVFECHPELSFWAMNGNRPMSLAKKKSLPPDAAGVQRSGLEERRHLLRREGYDDAFLITRVASAKQCGADDFLDACAAAWTAQRIFRREAVRFPATAEFDERGLDMAIWA